MNTLQRKLLIEDYCKRCKYLDNTVFPEDVAGLWCVHPDVLSQRAKEQDYGFPNIVGVNTMAALDYCNTNLFKAYE